VPVGLRRGGGGVDAEQPPAVLLTQQQGEQRLCQWFAGRAALGPDVLGEPGDVPGVAAAVQGLGEFGEAGGLGDHQPVQADELIGVDAADDARGEHLERVVVAGGVQAHGGGELPDHGGEQPGLVAVVGVEGPLGDLGRRGELVDRARAVAAVEEDVEGLGEDLGFPRASLVGRRPTAFAQRGDVRLPAHDHPPSPASLKPGASPNCAACRLAWPAPILIRMIRNSVITFQCGPRGRGRPCDGKSGTSAAHRAAGAPR
jgi:hypothetical protein